LIVIDCNFSSSGNEKGKVVASSKSGPWWVLWVCVCPWLIRALLPKVLQLTNLWFGLCRFAWIIDLLVTHPTPFWSSSTPLYPQSATSQGVCPNSFSFCYFHLWTHSWTHQGAWGCVILNDLYEFEGLAILQIGWKTLNCAINFLLYVIVCSN
jgi:hypothetical protein